MKASQPIGVFDSGLGGLTILKALKTFLPNEQFIYFGDTAHLPYGDKSEEALLSYVKDITDFLYSRSCKMVVVACNSASTVLSIAKDLKYNQNQIVEVISPIVNLIAKQSKYHDIAIIGTRKTINSGMFNSALEKRNPNLNIIARQTPLLVPMIEEGFLENEMLFPIFKRYFHDFDKTELIIPACTHYPIIYNQIETFFKNRLKVLHTPKIIAEEVQEYLRIHKLENPGLEIAEDEFHLSDLTESFKQEASLFLGKSINLQKTLLN